jgi:hypothetical protein
MGVKLRIAWRQFGKEAEDEIFINEGVLQEAENVGGAADVPAGEIGGGTAGKNSENDGMAEPVKPASFGQAGIEKKWIASQAKVANVPACSVTRDDFEDGWVKVKMKVAIDVVQGEASFAEAVELGGDFFFKLRMAAAVEKIFETDFDGVVGEIRIRINKIGNFGGRKRGFSKGEGEMEADAERGILAGKLDGFGESFAIYHETGGCEDATLVGLDDGLIDGMGAAEIVRIHDEAAHHPTP